jgi:hypothetical protein
LRLCDAPVFNGGTHAGALAEIRLPLLAGARAPRAGAEQATEAEQ